MSNLLVYPTLPGITYTLLKTPAFNTLDMKAPNGYEVRIAQSLNPIWTWTLIYDFLHDFFWGSYTGVSELRTLMGFFNYQSGMAGSFLFTDPDDYNVGPALSTVAWTPLTTFPLGFGILDSANHWQKVTAVTTGQTGATIPTFNHSGGTTADSGVTWTDEGAYTSAGFPNCPLAQLQLVNNGTTYYSPIQRTLDGNFYEDITDLNGDITVYANGVLKTHTGGSPDYSISTSPGLALPTASFMGLYLIWNAMPTGPITASFNFYFRVRFETDSQDFEKFLGIGSSAAATIAGQGGGYYTIGGSEAVNGTGYLKLTTARPNPL